MINKTRVKNIIIDNKMRKIEKNFLESLGYSIVELPKCNNVYEEISSHTDIFISKLGNNIIVDPSIYEFILSKLNNSENINIIKGDIEVKEKYPLDIPYNVCVIGNYAIHNFKYTSLKLLDFLKKEKYNLINVNQGYTNCSIAVIDDNSIIINDKGLYETLSKYDFDILFIEDELDIKLLKNDGEYSSKKGFIGGCISRIENKVIIFGDIDRIDKNGIISDFIKKRELEIVDFKGQDIIDYGGIVVV